MPDLSWPRFLTLFSGGFAGSPGHRDDQGGLPVSACDPANLFVLFFFTIGMLFISRFLALKGIMKNVITFYAIAGVMSTFVVSLVLLAWGIRYAHVDLFILAVIPLMAVAATLLVWACMRYLLGWKYVTDHSTLPSFSVSCWMQVRPVTGLTCTRPSSIWNNTSWVPAN